MPTFSGPFNEFLKQQGYVTGDRIDAQTTAALRQKWLADQERTRQQAAFGSGATQIGMKPNDAAALWQLGQGGSTGLQQAQGLMETFRQRQGMTTPAEEQAMTGQRLQQQQSGFNTMLNALQEQRQQQAFPLEQQARQAQINAANRAAQPPPPLGPGEKDALLYQQQTGGQIPNGYRPQRRFGTDPQTNQPFQFIDVQPVEGTAPYAAAETKLRAAEQGINILNDFLDNLATYGTEKGGPKALKLAQGRDRILAVYAQLENLGVLQPGEAERLSNVLPDPTSLWNQLSPTRAESIGQVYEQVLGQLEAQYKDLTGQFWYIPAQPVTPEQQAR